MDYNTLPIGDKFPEVFNAVIEIPQGSHNKYEIDKETGLLMLDRVLHSPMYYPVDYGFIPQTHADDGDALDVLLLTDSPVFPGCMVEVRPIAAFKMSDDKGLDDKILCVATGNPNYKQVQNLEDVAPHTLKAISHFFETYKTLENKEVKVVGWLPKEEALELLKKARI